MILQIILLYLSFAVVDVMDKFLISKRKVRPLSYTFFTVVTGGLLLLFWPLVFRPMSGHYIFLNLLCGMFYGLVMYAYFRLLSFREVSRVVPVVFGLVPMFDLIFSLITGKSPLTPLELSAICLLVPGVLLIAWAPAKDFYKHLGLMVLCALLFSSYNFFWQYSSQTSTTLNNLMWNRLGAALGVAMLLFLPQLRKSIFKTEHIEKKKHTGWLFFIKQAIGGINFIGLSYFLSVAKVPVVDALSGFRYGFLFIFAAFFGIYHKHILDERLSGHILKLKISGLVLVCAGTALLFLKA